MAVDELEQILDEAAREHWGGHPDDVSLPFSLAERFRAIVQVQGATVLEPTFAILDRLIRPLFALRQVAGVSVSAIDPRVMREIERWNIPGVAMLVPEFAPMAEVVYARLLTRLRELQGSIEARLHKGTPYHMMGWARLLRNDQASAREYFRLAAFEDAVKGEGWPEEPAARVLEGTWGADSEFEWVTNLLGRANLLDEPLRRIYLWNPELLMLQLEQQAS